MRNERVDWVANPVQQRPNYAASLVAEIPFLFFSIKAIAPPSRIIALPMASMPLIFSASNNQPKNKTAKGSETPSKEAFVELM